MKTYEITKQDGSKEYIVASSRQQGIYKVFGYKTLPGGASIRVCKREDLI